MTKPLRNAASALGGVVAAISLAQCALRRGAQSAEENARGALVTPRLAADCARIGACLCPWKDDQKVSSWVAIAPLANLPTSACANFGSCEWNLGVRGDAVVAHHARADFRDESLPFPLPEEAAPRPQATRSVARVDDGWLVQFNAGEWGARLWWFSVDGSSRKNLGGVPGEGFVTIGGAPFVFTNENDGVNSRGELLALRKRGTGWQTEPFANVGDGARVALADKPDAALVVTESGLVRVGADGTAKPLWSAKSWGGLYPSSLLVHPDGSIYVGMRFAVARLRPRGESYEETWLIPPSCRPTGDTCASECSPNAP